jgi:hypothetical protein
MRFIGLIKFFAVAVVLAIGCGQAAAAPVKVDLTRAGETWELRRDGKAFFVKGAGGTNRFDQLAAAGANSVRTWGVDNIEPLLDDAHKNGLTVTVGIWLRHEGDKGFSYNEPAMLKEQLELVRKAVLRYKDHPAVLMWGIGNEMEGYEDGGNPLIWKHVNEAAKLAKSLDSNHPVMTVIVELGGKRIESLERFCPDVDIVGINTYAGASSVATRYGAFKPTKPYIITEFGPPGFWEVSKTRWGAPLEPTSNEKAESYRRAYLGSVKDKPFALGSYAFLWGNKQERTATWFGMFLPDGVKVSTVDTMTELWSGKFPASACPVIRELKAEGATELKPKQTLKIRLAATDPAQKSLRVRWIVQPEQTKTLTAGKEEELLAEIPSAIIRSDENGCEITAPTEPGGYRVFAYVHNASGASVGNIPFHVASQPQQAGQDNPKIIPVASSKPLTDQ